jgi:hypothetical protein
MTRQRAKELLPVLQAYADGKTIQIKDQASGIWRDIDYTHFHDVIEYRVKPEPREWKLTFWQDGAVTLYAGDIDAMRGESIRVREILD